MSATPTPWQLFEGERVNGKYRLVKLLGYGINSGVFEAEPLAEQQRVQHVALKLQPPDEHRELQQIAEIASLAGMPHPSLLRSFTPGVCTLNNTRMLYLPSELADETLRARVSHELLTIDEARDVGIAILSALVLLHEQSCPVVHRSVEPTNIFRLGARWKLGDFGLLRSVPTRAGVRIALNTATGKYSPPESYEGLLSPAWDVWSFGILLHEAITGTHPFASEELPREIQRAVCTENPNLAENLPPDLLIVIRACLDKDPSVRWPADRVLEALEQLHADELHHQAVPQHKLHRKATVGKAVEGSDAVKYDGPLMESIVVSASGEADFDNIGEALHRAANGATILVRQGRYYGTLRVDRPVEIQGDAAGVTLEAVGSEAIIVESGGVRIAGLTIASRPDMHQPKHHGVVIRQGPTTIEACDISCSSLAAVTVSAEAVGVEIIRCSIHDGKTAGVLLEAITGCKIDQCTVASNLGPAIHIKSGSEHSITGCDIFSGRESGIVIDKSSVCSIGSSTIRGNEGAGILLQESSSASLHSCRICGNKHAGVSARAHSKLSMIDCKISDNMLSGAAVSAAEAHFEACQVFNGQSNGLSISDGAICTLEDSDVYSNAFAGIKVSHGGVFSVLKSRLYDGKRNAVVVQAEGTARFWNCDIYGNGQVGIKVEECGRAELTECRLYDSPEGSISFSGAGTVERCTISRSAKSAIEVISGGSPTMRDCQLEANKMPAILVHGKCEAVVERCTVVGNEMAGIAIGEAAKALIADCTVQSGSQVGLVIWDRAKCIIERCEISSCSMDGIRVMQHSEAVIIDCRICDNAHYGVHVSGESAGEITECDLTRNGLGPAFVDAGCTTQSAGNIV